MILYSIQFFLEFIIILKKHISFFFFFFTYTKPQAMNFLLFITVAIKGIICSSEMKEIYVSGFL